MDTADFALEYKFTHLGEELTFDPVMIGFSLRILEGEEDPSIIHTAIKHVFGIECSMSQAIAIMQDYQKYADAVMTPTLEQNFDIGPSLITTTESSPTSTEASP